MPYIDEDIKDAILAEGMSPSSPGELNFAITMECLHYLDTMTEGHPKNVRYGLYAEVIGALECAKLEFYRRALAPYEDKKIEKNGDVY